MNRLFLGALITLELASAAWAAEPAPLTTLRQIHALSNEQASKALPVAFEATVTYYRNYEHTLFVQDGEDGIYISAPSDIAPTPGDRVLVNGVTRPSFHPYIEPRTITLLSHGSLPKPLPANFSMLIGGDRDCRLVTMSGVIHAADLISNENVLSARIELMTDSGLIEVNIDTKDENAISALLDSKVEVTGVASGTFDGKMQLTGILLHVQSLADLKVLERSTSGPWTLPLTPMDKILTHASVENHTSRVRVSGTITYYQPSASIVLQSGSKSLWIQTHTLTSLHIGDLADVTGFPEAHNGFLVLTSSEIRDTGIQAPVSPIPADWKQLTTSGNIFDLVSIEGKVVTEVREVTQDEYVLSTGDRVFSAIYSHPYDAPPMAMVPLGSTVRVTGICVQDSSNPFAREVPFDILLRTYNDIAVVAPPTMLNIRNLLILAGILLAIAGIRSWTLERRVRLQTAALAERVEEDAILERKRSRILEDINGSEPLASILEQVCSLVSSTLGGAPCWCQIAGGAALGSAPAESGSLQPLSVEIPARSGSALGILYAGVSPRNLPKTAALEALSMGARLATLAIETRHLYTDLVRRSEIDLLTDIHNRFSLDKQLDARINEADRIAGIFGLIYIDLDKFKEVNDRYGHHIGDLYLQEVAARMKRQLRGGDILARLGGDEFAALLNTVRSRADVEEIVRRIERSFDEPFVLEGHSLRGYASIGFALYPEDGTSKSALLSAADSAMYAIKKDRHKTTANAVA